MAASLGAALVAMVASLSEGRPKYAEHAALHARAASLGRNLVDRFLTLADEDATAYAAFSVALKMPKETDDQRQARTAALRSAARASAEAPLACLEASAELVAAAESLAGRSNVNAASDVAVAALLGEAAARGAAANVLINLPATGNETWSADVSRRVEALLARTEGLAGQARSVVAAGVSRPPIDPSPS